MTTGTVQDTFSEKLTRSLRQACGWLVEVAQVKHARLADDPGRPTAAMRYDDWRGAIKGEYHHAKREWRFFCPIWHTGQAVAALAQASRVLGDPKLLEAARFSADFVLRQRVADPARDDFGLIFAFEDDPDRVNTSAVMESLPGLIELFRQTQERQYLDAAAAALRWIAKKAYLSDEALFQDCYDPQTKAILPHRYGTLGRPLVEDAVFLTVGQLTHDENLKRIHFQVLERLLRDEEPPGNWIRYAPCNAARGNLHPRHAYWWGLPFLDGYLETRDERYLEAACRAARWYIQAQRRDGGLFRGTYRDFTTDSFGHATSGMACAVKMWVRLWEQTRSDEWLAPIRKGLEFCVMMQMTAPEDPNLRGVIVEKILAPDGTDRSLIYIRDLGTIFYVQAAAAVLAAGLDKRLE